MTDMMDEDYEWQPPSEAELKIIQAKRERSDKISKLMGDYLLKGYKMLGAQCSQCTTILLQDKHGVNYCVACQELDTDTDKDDPALSSAAARSQILEGSVADFSDAVDDLSFMRGQNPKTSPSVITMTTNQSRLTATSPVITAISPQRTNPVASTTMTSSAVLSQSNDCNLNLNFEEAVETLCGKIKWATAEMQASRDIDTCVKLCHMIKAAADAVESLKSASR